MSSIILTVPPKTNGRLPTTVRLIQSLVWCQKFCAMFQKSIHRRRSWVNQCRSRLRFHRLVSLASRTRRVNSPLLEWPAKTHCRSHFQPSAHAASKKSPVLQPARCGINFMCGAIGGCRANWCNAPRRLATKRSWSRSIRRCSVGASAMCVAASRFHQKLV